MNNIDFSAGRHASGVTHKNAIGAVAKSIVLGGVALAATVCIVAIINLHSVSLLFSPENMKYTAGGIGLTVVSSLAIDFFAKKKTKDLRPTSNTQRDQAATGAQRSNVTLSIADPIKALLIQGCQAAAEAERLTEAVTAAKLTKAAVSSVAIEEPNVELERILEYIQASITETETEQTDASTRAKKVRDNATDLTMKDNTQLALFHSGIQKIRIILDAGGEIQEVHGLLKIVSESILPIRGTAAQKEVQDALVTTLTTILTQFKDQLPRITAASIRTKIRELPLDSVLMAADLHEILSLLPRSV